MMTVTTEDGMDDEAPLSDEDARTVRFLKMLVTGLAVTMIAGVLAIVVLLVTRLQRPALLPALPAGITLPEGAEATAFTQGAGWYAVVTADDRILIFDRATGRLAQTVEIAQTE